MGAKGALSQRVELPGLDIRFELPVPDRGIEFSEPLAEIGELFWRELLDLPFDGFYGAHGSQYTVATLRASIQPRAGQVYFPPRSKMIVIVSPGKPIPLEGPL